MKLTRLKDRAHRLPPVAPWLGGAAEVDRRRNVANPLRALYFTTRWRTLRWEVLVDAHFRCARCGREHPTLTPICDALAPLGQLGIVKGRAPDYVADHINPHRGIEERFWDRGNLQCLCASCHSGAKQREEQGSLRGPMGEGGV